MNIRILAATAALALSITPAFAGEGTGEPFRNNATVFTSPAQARVADTGASAYPNVAGRPGANLPLLANDTLPENGSESPIQTANSLPTNFEAGTVAYAQANSIHRWFQTHAATRFAGRVSTPNG